ncbi:MAG: GNAT family N-acetyltransferase [Acidobacteria bacterium]|nr:GNAT family N-acetyltransferase [Acidobacteriota bacterium]
MSDRVALSVGQFAGAWEILCKAAPGNVLASEGGTEYRFSGMPIPFFNIAMAGVREESAEGLGERARRACAWAADKGVPWFFVTTQEWMPEGVDVNAVLDGCGLAPLMPLTGMWAGRVAGVESVPEGLELRLAEDEATSAAMVNVNSAAYGMDLGAGAGVLGSARYWREHVGVVGMLDGEAVSCTAVMMVDGYRYVAFVATQPGHQRKGYADAAMRRALEVAAERHGESPTVLHATAAGKPVYERMGYVVISEHTIYMEKRFLEGH